ncbi:hypothetical protein CHLNCDRAFT_56756 [Chlorella variabilis]|uniref:Photolyase/cryptochrome alpha/beta domain-containing protein n=1 Tax=Chlorella variabilis TaxID=554065 RepID=E1Z506_CHLVA|nr:hypothetical protein CHLNCDRAFT_56756 [Chlorella variabilis]EFN59149.1 hypothetical protein CHLNCDRAFT_56756 [Chlorella variabilis]|eukprot:XP_005851251.1 hypothetical protein CHLNCDRAFT_56756 [Chlorella variabilis]
MASTVSRGVLPVAAAAPWQRRPLRPRLLAVCASAPAVAHQPCVLGGLAQQLRQLKQFKVCLLGGVDAPAPAADRGTQSAARGVRQPQPTRQPAGVGDGAAPGCGAGRRPGIVWFRGDLRLHDNEALARAQAECSSLLPVYCFDPREYGKSPQGYDKTGPYRAQFLAEAVADLRAALRAAGSELVVRVGRPEEVVGELVRRTGAGAVYCHTEVAYEDLRAEAAVRAAAEAGGARLRAYWANTLCHLDDLPFSLDQLPQNFDKFREQIGGVAVRAALPAPQELHGLPLGGRVDPGDIPTLEQLGLQPLPAAAATGSIGEGGSPRGGEGEALRQLQRFVAAAGGQAAAGPVAAAHGSNFSANIAPWLATGCLSPRRMLEDARRALAAPTAAGATPAASRPLQAPLEWVRFELYWRDFFRLLSRKYSSISGARLGSSAATAAAAAVAT